VIEEELIFPLPSREGTKGRGKNKWLKCLLFQHPHLHPPPSRGRKVFEKVGNFPLPRREGVRGRGMRIAQFRNK
jgi:hypothetical protein